MLFIIIGGFCCYASGCWLFGLGLQTRARYVAHALGLLGMGFAAWGFWHSF